jgi:ABC-type branched-subunit amino acid transport system substrate-binding protein
LGGSAKFRSLALLGFTLALAGCGGQAPNLPNGGALPPLPGGASTGTTTPTATGKTSGPVALLLPLSGPLAPVGTVLENAAKLAFPDNAGPALDIRDTGGTPAGAVTAAQAAIAAGDGLILGPLTSAEAHAVAPIAATAGVNVLAFTNDSSVAGPGIWTLGITPTQQVQRVMQEAANNGRTQLAALLPDDQFGHSLSDALSAETTALSEPAPRITFYEQDNFDGLNQAIEQLSDFADRGQSIEAQIKAAQDLNTAAGRATARALQHQQIPPPPFNALFIGATSGDALAEIANFLPYYSVSPPQVQLLGPALWENIAPQMANNAVLMGAQFAAPDPTANAAFVAKYQTTYGSAPPPIADVAFDAAAIARLAASGGGYTTTVLTDPSGFTGTDGLLVLQPNGQVLRGLAVLQVAPGAPIVASPAPTQLSTPAS